jgi:hypothetical protein
VLNTLRKRTFAQPWVIVLRNPLNSAVDIEEANVHPSLGDHSPPSQAHKDERASPGHTRTQARVRTFAQHWAIVHPRGGLPHVTYLGHFHPHLPITFTYPAQPPPCAEKLSLHIVTPTPHDTSKLPHPPPKHHQNTTKSPTPTTTLPHSPFSTNFSPLSPNIHNTNHTNPFWPFFFLLILTTALYYSRV